jgi:hypothetical protein
MESSASADRVASTVLNLRCWWALALVLLVYAVVEAPGADWGDVRKVLPLAGSAVLVAALALIESPLRAAGAAAHPPLPAIPGSAQRREPARAAHRGLPVHRSAWRWRSCSPVDRLSQRTSCQSRTRWPMKGSRP